MCSSRTASRIFASLWNTCGKINFYTILQLLAFIFATCYKCIYNIHQRRHLVNSVPGSSTFAQRSKVTQGWTPEEKHCLDRWLFPLSRKTLDSVNRGSRDITVVSPRCKIAWEHIHQKVQDHTCLWKSWSEIIYWNCCRCGRRWEIPPQWSLNQLKSNSGRRSSPLPWVPLWWVRFWRRPWMTFNKLCQAMIVNINQIGLEQVSLSTTAVLSCG